MKNKKLITVTLAAAMLSASLFSASAEDMISKIVRRTEGEELIRKLSVKGNLGEEYKNKKVLLYVVKKDNTLTDINKFQSIMQTDSDSNGGFEFLFDFDGDAGDYKVTVTADTLTTPETSEFYLADISKLEDLLDNLKNHKITPKELEKEFSDIKLYGLDEVAYNLLNPKGKEALCQNIVTDLSDFTVGGIDDFFEKAALTAGLNTATSYTDVKKLLDYHSELANLKGSPLYSDFEALDDKTLVYQEMLAHKYRDAEEIKDVFSKGVVFASVKSVSSSSQISGILEKYKDYIDGDIDSTTYKTYKSKIENYLGERLESYTSLSMLEKDLKSLLNNPDLYFKESGGGSGGGGGGVKGGSVSMTPGYNRDDKLSEELIFNDVPASYWGREAIISLYNKGIVRGKSDKLFDPEATVTRAEFVKMLNCALKFDKTENSISFSDVNPTDWFYTYVSVAAGEGIVMGISKDMFKPENNITRQDAAVIIKRALEKKGNTLKKAEISYTDKEAIASYAISAVECLTGYIKGYEDKTFRPNNTLSRGEAAQLIYNIIK